MKVFYSELAENPAYYSFGYSIYAKLEEGDSIAEAYEKGFLPAVVARNQPERLMYQVRSVRVPTNTFKRLHYHNQVGRRAEGLGVWEERVVPAPHTPDEELLAFVLTFFHFRFGKDSMRKERVRALFASGWITHIREIRIAHTLAVRVLEHHEKEFVHVLYFTYAKQYERTHVGGHIFTRVIEWARKEGRPYVYLGATYGMWMRYKVNFAPLQIWDGENWLEDPKGKKLKALLHEGVHLVPYADMFRITLEPFYAPPYGKILSKEMRILATLFDASPVSALAVFALPVVLFAATFFLLLAR